MKVLISCLPFMSLTCGQFLYDVFPDGFIWSTATSAHQVEGAWDTDGKGENIWDNFTHQGLSAQNATADVACDSYNKIPHDIAMLRELGVASYRFSIAWSRILPNGTLAGGINQPGIDYYNNLIKALRAADIQPMVTLYHWDLPQPLQDIGGWENEALVTHFKDYADTCFRNFGDKVDLWLTFNEPWVISWLGYGNGIFAPAINARPGVAPYKAAHTMLKSHAEAWHLYDGSYRATQQGRISITLDADWKEPNSQTQADTAAAERALQFKLGWYANPIFGSGDYPEIMREKVRDKSAAQGLGESRLPNFTQDEVNRIRGTFDYFGLNHYTTQLIADNPGLASDCVSYFCDQDVSESHDPSWPTTGSSWLRMVPWGLRKLLNWIKDEYGDVPIIITENGCSDRNSSMEDTHRVNFYREYINEALKANKTDNVNLFGYTAWSVMDNFEWAQGYDEKFGLYHVNFTDPDRPRIAKQSAREYTKIIEANGFPDPTGSASNIRATASVLVWGYLVHWIER